MADERRIGLDEVARHFEDLEDPRCSVNRKHPLVSVVVIALMAVLAGADGPTAIAEWAALKEEFLTGVLDLPNGVPRKDVFRRVLMLLEARRLSSLFRRLAAGVARHGRRRRPAWSSRSSRLTARRPGGATIGGRGWVPCIRSASGPASSGCRWGRWPAPRSPTRSRPSPSCCGWWTSKGRSSPSMRSGLRRRSRRRSSRARRTMSWP